MKGIYPYNTPIILTDDLFVDYGGHTGTSTTKQRQAAYLIAEKQMTTHLSTFLLPTTVTGSYIYGGYGTQIVTEHGYVNSVDQVTLISSDGCDCGLTQDGGCSISYENTYGCVFVYSTPSSCGCGWNSLSPFQVQLVYNAGLPSGSSYQADMLLALTMAAEINLNEMIDPTANEGTGDIGIQEFSNQSYKEVRVTLGRTAFGTSARAQKIANLVAGYRKYRALSVGGTR